MLKSFDEERQMFLKSKDINVLNERSKKGWIEVLCESIFKDLQQNVIKWTVNVIEWTPDNIRIEKIISATN